MYSYPEKVCLIQLSMEEEDAIVDPLAKGLNIQPMLNALSKVPLIMHGADYDLRLLYKGYKFRPGQLFDTMLAAKLLNDNACSLANLCEEYLGIHLIKKYQKSNWGQRPLSKEHLNYAIKDAFYLHELKIRMEKKLVQCDRLEWHTQNCQKLIKECTQAVKSLPSREWRLGGSERLSRKELAIQKAIWYWREAEAIKSKRPVYFIMKPDTMIQISISAAANKDYKKLIPQYSHDKLARLLKTIEETLQLSPQKYPMKTKKEHQRFSPAQQELLEKFTRKRDQQAKQLHIDPTLIASRSDLVDFVRNPDTIHLTQWQKDILAKTRFK